MPNRVGTIERAYQLARSGDYGTVRQLRTQLEREGYFDAASQIMSPSLMRDLGRCCRAAQAARPGLQSVEGVVGDPPPRVEG